MSVGEALFGSREHLESIVQDALTVDLMGQDLAEHIVDELVNSAAVMPTERWDEECHRCDQRIGDHTVDGRCPASGERPTTFV